jgi:thioredoxin 1
MKQVTRLTRHNFDEAVSNGGSAIVDFYASWCGPCRAFAPFVERLAREHPEVRVAKLNVDEAPEIAEQYGIRTVPTLIRFDRGEPVAALVGPVRYDHLESLLGLAEVAPVAAA